MGTWSIGPIVGHYQPEDFSESQVANFDETSIPGDTTILMSKGWSRREATISFVVDNMCAGSIGGAAQEPEAVWFRIMQLLKPPGGWWPEEVDVTIPGWPGNKAFIVKASIKRTFIEGPAVKAVRAVISVTLKESAGTNTMSAGEAQEAAAAAAAAALGLHGRMGGFGRSAVSPGSL